MEPQDTIFLKGRDIADPAERAAYLTRACGNDAELLQRVEAMLRDAAGAGEFFGPEPAGATVTEGPGTVIGRYKLLQRIGEGGMGVVYMAEQREPVIRKVALKIIKLGMDTRQVVARFEAERQALALMDHPNIAKVLDGGATGSGRPYFVMDLVPGLPITQFCDEANLATRERLGLFLEVCSAVQHAHQKGIIHRDLKPSNILVTLHGDKPVPKVIDFGVAKATQGRLTEKTLFTQFQQFIGTPAYMSPEQASLSGLDVDTRSDIYALGVLLYELLTGRTPFDGKELLKAGLDEMRRTIRETEPPRPSNRISTLQGEDLTVTALRRRTDPPKLVHLVRGDLDWIVMKALEKDRARRYETANSLAVDIKRHLTNEPIVARPPSATYRFQKLVRRNKLAFWAAVLMVAVLLAATGISTWQAVRATRAEALASQRLADSEAVSKFLTEAFQSPDPARDGRTITVAETLDTATKKLETDLANQPGLQAKLQATLGATYLALGLFREAIPLEEKVRDYYLATSGLENTDTLTAMGNLAGAYFEAGRADEARKLREQVLALSRKVNGPEHPDTLWAMQSLAWTYGNTGSNGEAVSLQEQLVTLSRKVNGPEHPDTIAAMSLLALYDCGLGRYDEALKLGEKTLELQRKINRPELPNMDVAMDNIADVYRITGRSDDAVKLREQELALRRNVLGPEHPDTLHAVAELADDYELVGRWDEAVKLHEQALDLRRKVLGPEHPDTLDSMAHLANAYCAVGRDKEAISLLEQAIQADPKNTLNLLILAVWQTWFGQDADYEATRRRFVQQAEGTDEAAVAQEAAKVYCLRPSTNTALLGRALKLARRGVELSKSSGDLAWCQLDLGMAEYRTGQYTAAEQTLALAEQSTKNVDAQGTARLFRAMSLFEQNKPEGARKLFTQAEAEMSPLPKDEGKPLLDAKLARIEDNFHDTLVCWLAYKEAKTPIEGPSATAAEPSVPK